METVFVGRVDLSMALGTPSQDGPRMDAAVERVCEAGGRCGRTVGMFVRPEDAQAGRETGASFFLVGSGRAFLPVGSAGLLARAGRR